MEDSCYRVGESIPLADMFHSLIRYVIAYVAHIILLSINALSECPSLVSIALRKEDVRLG